MIHAITVRQTSCRRNTEKRIIPTWRRSNFPRASDKRHRDGLVSAINIDNLKSSDLIGRIIQDNARCKARDDPLVYHAQEKRRKFRKGITCHKCGKEGHIKPECTEPAKKDEATTAFAGAAIKDTTAPEYSF